MTDIRTLLGIGLIVGGFMLPSGGGGILPTPEPVLPKPSVSVDLPLEGIPAGRRAYFSDVYSSMALVLERDGKRAAPGVKTIIDFTALHASALQLSVDRDQVGVYPGLGEAIDAAFRENVGDENVPVDDGVRAKLAEVCRALAWEFRNGS